MKVCHFTSAHKSDDIRIFHKECVSLAEAGYEVYLVASNTEEKILQGVTIINVDKPNAGRFSRMLKTSKAVYKKALSLDAEIYHFHDPELLRFALRLKRKGKYVIYDAHEDVPRQIMAKFWIPKMFRKIISVIVEKYENHVARKLAAVVVSTPHILKRFEKINANSIDVCNYPMMKELVESTSWMDKKDEICYVGGITEVRGIQQLMDVLELLPKIRLNLAGNFSTEELKENIIRRKSWTAVSFHGYVDRTELLDIFQDSKIGMVTLLNTPNHLDSLPIKMFEYMSARIPVIASNFPLWKEIIKEGNCGICVNPEDPKEIAAAIQQIIDNPELAQEMGANGRKLVLEKYNWDIEKKKLIEIYSLLRH
jgi:glycosyltransferase involved in cell wall biosynthesis